MGMHGGILSKLFPNITKKDSDEESIKYYDSSIIIENSEKEKLMEIDIIDLKQKVLTENVLTVETLNKITHLCTQYNEVDFNIMYSVLKIIYERIKNGEQIVDGRNDVVFTLETFEDYLCDDFQQQMGIQFLAVYSEKNK